MTGKQAALFRFTGVVRKNPPAVVQQRRFRLKPFERNHLKGNLPLIQPLKNAAADQSRHGVAVAEIAALHHRNPALKRSGGGAAATLRIAPGAESVFRRNPGHPAPEFFRYLRRTTQRKGDRNRADAKLFGDIRHFHRR